MGDLVLFSSKPSVRSIAAGESAAILFFTGVRYYRMDEVAMPAAPVEKRRRARPRKSRRDVLVELHG